MSGPVIRHPRLFHWWCSKGGLITSLVLVAINGANFLWSHWWPSALAGLASATMIPLWVKTHDNWKQAFAQDGLIDDSFAEMRRRRSKAGTN